MTPESQAAVIAGHPQPAGPNVHVPWHVIDTNARSGEKREHEVITRTYDDGRDPDIKKYRIGSEDPGEPMPMEHALRFLKDKAFIVRAPDGKRVTPPPKVEGGTGAFELPEEQTIANWDELTTSALFKRAKIIPGSEAITPATAKEDIVAFLMGWRRAQKKGAEGIAQELAEKLAGGDQLAGQASESELTTLFGEEKSPLLAELERQGSKSVA